MGKLLNKGTGSVLVVLNRAYITLAPGDEYEVPDLTERELAKLNSNPDLVLTGTVNIIRYKTFVDSEITRTETFEVVVAPEPEPDPEPEPEPEPEEQLFGWAGFVQFLDGIKATGVDSDAVEEAVRNNFKKTELIALCAEVGLDEAGNKDDLIQRLLEKV